KKYSTVLQLDLTVNVDGLINLPSLVEENTYRIIQEAMNNTKKHGETTKVELLLIQKNNYLTIYIEDKGKGFNIKDSNVPDSHGLKNIRQRVKMMNGKLEIKSNHNNGTKNNINVHIKIIKRKFRIYIIILLYYHNIMRKVLEFLLSTVDDIEVMGGFSEGKSFLEYIEAHDLPDIVLLDLVMPEMNGIEITEILKSKYPEVKILVLTSYI